MDFKPTYTKIIIDPRCKMNYASYYLKGIFEIFDKVHFSSRLFADSLFQNREDYKRGMCCIIYNYGQRRNIYIDFGDAQAISLKHYEWADVYAKINLSKEDNNHFPKTLPIGPSFGINILTIYLVLRIFCNILITRHLPVSIKEYINDFGYLFVRRRKYEKYLGSKSETDYVFAISTLWPYKNEMDSANDFRGKFICCCKKIFSVFEGGFFYVKSAENSITGYKKYLSEYKNFIFKKRISPTTYLKKTKKSTLVFNTPAVAGCLGWKLGEYLAMGKAIISLPLKNMMPIQYNTIPIPIPIPILFIENISDLEKTIIQLKNDDDLRKELELKSIHYFNNFLTPRRVIERILEQC